jgi:Heliorhodopsin
MSPSSAPPPPSAALWACIVGVPLVVAALVCWLVLRRYNDASRRPMRRRARRQGATMAAAVRAGDFASAGELIALHALAFVLHVLSGTAGVLIASTGDPSVGVVAPLFEFLGAAHDGQFATPRPKQIFAVHILVPSIIVEFITAFFHAVYLMALVFPELDDALRTWVIDSPSANPLRWVEYAITATTMSCFGSIAIGINDFYYFLKLVFSGVCVQLLGYGIETLDLMTDAQLKTRLFNLLFYGLGQLLNLPSIAILLYQIYASKTHGAFWLFLENTLPFALWFNTFGIICQCNFKKWRQFQDPYFTERWYIVLSLSTKIAVFWLSFGTFKKIAEDNGYSDKAGVNWNAVRYSAMSVPAAWVIAYALYDGMVWSAASAAEDARLAADASHQHGYLLFVSDKA